MTSKVLLFECLVRPLQAVDHEFHFFLVASKIKYIRLVVSQLWQKNQDQTG